MNQHTMSQAEWQVMRVLWAYPHSRSQEIIDRLEQDFSWKPATVKTLLNRLKSKEFIQMVKENGKYYYDWLVSEEEYFQTEWRRLLLNSCRTKQGKILEDVLGLTELSRGDIEGLLISLEKKRIHAPEVVECACFQGQCRCGHHCSKKERK